MIAFGFTMVFLISMFLGAGSLIQNNVAAAGPSEAHDPVMKTASCCTHYYSGTDITVPQINGWGWEYFSASVYYSYSYTQDIIEANKYLDRQSYTFLNFPKPTTHSNSQYVKASVSSFNGFTCLDTKIICEASEPDGGYRIISSQVLGLSGTIHMSGDLIQSFNANLVVYSAADPDYSYVTGSYTYSKTYSLSRPANGLSNLPVVLDD